MSSNINKIMAVKLMKLLREKTPDLIISTHPFSTQMCSYLKKKNKIHCKIANVMTDFAPHEQWLIGNEFIEYFFVAHDGMKKQLLQKGINENKIFVTGIPLSNRFLEHYDKKEILESFGLDLKKRTILFFAGRRAWTWEK